MTVSQQQSATESSPVNGQIPDLAEKPEKARSRSGLFFWPFFFLRPVISRRMAERKEASRITIFFFSNHNSFLLNSLRKEYTHTNITLFYMYGVQYVSHDI